MNAIVTEGLDDVVRAVPGVVAVYPAVSSPGAVWATATAAVRGHPGRVVASPDGSEVFVSVGVAATAGARTVARAVQEAVRTAAAAGGASPRVRVRVAHVD